MSITYPPARPGVEVASANAELHRQQLAKAVNRINSGHMNVSAFVTLEAGAGTTVVEDARLSAQTCVALCPTSANAAAALSTTYIVCENNQMTIHHANNAQTDRTFTIGMIG